MHESYFEYMRKFLSFCVMCIFALAMHAQKFVDLGLPSGTLWCDKNEPGFYTYYEAMSSFSTSLPTKKQFEELLQLCQWDWNGNGYMVTGLNGKSIFLPGVGFRRCDGSMDRHLINYYGAYWTSNPSGENHDGDQCAWDLFFQGTDKLRMDYDDRCCLGQSVRLVR